MDLTSKVWFISVCLAVQQSNINGLSEHLRANGLGQGANEDVVLADMGKIVPEESQVWQDSRQDWYRVLGEIKTRDAIEWLVEEDLRCRNPLPSPSLISTSLRVYK